MNLISDVFGKFNLQGQEDHNFEFLCCSSWSELQKHKLHVKVSWNIHDMLLNVDMDHNFYKLLFKVSWNIHDLLLNVDKDHNFYKLCHFKGRVNV